MTVELDGTDTVCVAVTPGWIRSEAMLDIVGVTEETWRDALAAAGRTAGDTSAPAAQQTWTTSSWSLPRGDDGHRDEVVRSRRAMAGSPLAAAEMDAVRRV